jgi:hypothetical protein
VSAAPYVPAMGPRATYVVSVHEPEGTVMVEDVRSGERVRVAGLAEVGDQIARWRARPLELDDIAPRDGVTGSPP